MSNSDLLSVLVQLGVISVAVSLVTEMFARWEEKADKGKTPGRLLSAYLSFNPPHPARLDRPVLVGCGGVYLVLVGSVRPARAERLAGVGGCVRAGYSGLCRGRQGGPRSDHQRHTGAVQEMMAAFWLGLVIGITVGFVGACWFVVYVAGGPENIGKKQDS